MPSDRCACATVTRLRTTPLCGYSIVVRLLERGRAVKLCTDFSARLVGDYGARQGLLPIGGQFIVVCALGIFVVRRIGAVIPLHIDRATRVSLDYRRALCSEKCQVGWR